MTSGFTGHVAPSEWRWVIVVSALLLIIAFAPFLWAVVGIADTPWRFMGVLHDYQDGAVYISEAFQGAEGQLLTRFLHTAEPHRGTFFNAIYALIGQASRLTALPPVLMFHIARAAASIFMYMALYQLAAAIWMRLRTRRIFFIIAALGSGFGWLLGVVSGNLRFLDLSMPEAFPFYSSLVNVHYPLGIACLALASSVVINAFKPGMHEMPTTQNGGGMLFLLSVTLAFVYPLALLMFAVAFLVYLIFYSAQQKHFGEREWRWLLWFVVPALPLVVYYLALLYYNPLISALMRQENFSAAANPLVFVLSFGLPLLIALPGILRGVRRFEPYGDQFMLVWLGMALLLIYLPTGLQQRFVVGLMIPIAYFATRAIEDFWFSRLSRRWRYRVLVALVPVMAATHLFVLALPVQSFAAFDSRSTSSLLLERDYVGVFDWLKDRVEPEDVVLAAPSTSLWVPSRTGAHVVYGHPTLTLNAAEKRREVEAWYRMQETETCDALLNGSGARYGSYRVSYVIVGPRENRLGKTECTDLLDLVDTFGSVALYRYTPTTSVRP
ncbi:MAG: hypothetical protein SF029_05040 [bacterium]|nr:hypothetical protein [bacterium]